MVKLFVRELEMAGFKSFGDRATLVFPSHLTVVLGPNGSGKSNVVDAMRWVLGDQSFRNLRISEASDLLFMGQRGISSASVRLAFESSDGSSSEIQRKIYKSGESEYFLNGSVAKLKDIQRFLAEHQIGTRGFTIVNQGSADLFIKASPSERYVMISEMLGIRALEIKKFETKKNLDLTKERLKIAKLKLQTLAPQAEIFAREEIKRARRQTLLADQTTIQAQLSAQERYLVETRRVEISAQIRDSELALTEARLEVEMIGREIEQPVSQQIFTLRAKENDLWRQRSEILEKERGKDIQHKHSRQEIYQQLEAVLASDDLIFIKKIIRQVITWFDKKTKNDPEPEEAVMGQLASIDQALAELKRQITKEEEMERVAQQTIQKRLAQLKTAQGRGFTLEQELKNLQGEDKELAAKIKQLEGVAPRTSTVNEVNKWRHRLTDVEQELARLGEINEEMLARGQKIIAQLDKLKTDVAELEDSSSKITHLLSEYESTIRQQFSEGIKKINQALIEYFYKLYGGEAKLTCADEYEVHISINHPQKKVRILEALSGGEKALFSISLIFALIKISAPPFLVLDEIDAALDENNAYKFAAFLKELANQTQFIIVSHNRATIEAADVLFGVSHQAGRSRLFSLKIKDALQAIES